VRGDILSTFGCGCAGVLTLISTFPCDDVVQLFPQAMIVALSSRRNDVPAGRLNCIGALNGQLI
jgi:hypothetical protein